MRYDVQNIKRVTLTWEGHDAPAHVPQNYRRTNDWIVPNHVIVTFDTSQPEIERSLQGAVVTGQQFRMYASGDTKKRGPGRRYAEWEQTTWEWPTWRSMPHELQQIVRDAWLGGKVRPA